MFNVGGTFNAIKRPVTAALKSLAKVGNDHCVSRIQQMLTSISPDKTALRGEVQTTLQALRGKQ